MEIKYIVSKYYIYYNLNYILFIEQMKSFNLYTINNI